MPLSDALDFTFNWEGGYSDHPSDPGGKTRYGITEALARVHGYEGPMDELPRSKAEEIYREAFWEHPHLELEKVDAIVPELATLVFEWAVNCGPDRPARALQRELNRKNKSGQWYEDLRVDGWLGPKTLQALHAYLERRRPEMQRRLLLTGYAVAQGAYYQELVDRSERNEAFYDGWLNRLPLAIELPA